MLEVVPYELDEIKNELKRKAIEEFGIKDAEYEGSNVSQLINLLAYSTVISNTNFTFGLNEMFISQASDRRNVIKHARQMGYTHKRKVSFQYRIKLKVVKSGEVTLNKYSNFSSNGNNYVYFGESILDVYGTYAYIKILTNENNNKLAAVYLSNSLSKNKYLVTEEGQICKILHKEPVGTPRLLLEIVEGEKLPLYSQYGQEVFITDGTRSSGFRNFIKIGTIDTFVTDIAHNNFRIQLTLENNGTTFPMPVTTQHLNTNLIKNKTYFTMEIPTENPIISIDELVLVDYGDEIHIDLNNVLIEGNNIKLPINTIDITETFVPDTEKTAVVLDEITHKVKVKADEDIIADTLGSVEITYNDEITIKNIANESINYNENEITINEQIKTKIDKNLEIKEGFITLIEETNKIINSVIVTDSNGNKSIIDESHFTFTASSVTLTKDDGEVTDEYDNYTAEIEYDFYIPLEKAVIVISYTCDKDISSAEVKLRYNYTHDKDGYLAKRIFFSDFRGETKENENDYDPVNMPDGWDGFYASDFNSETNVLFFDISKDKPSIRSHNNEFHNCYCAVEGKDPVRIDKLIKTPFRKTRFSYSEEIIDPATEEIIGYKPYDPEFTFASVYATNVKDEIEIIVKEGNIRRWNDETEDSKLEREKATKLNLPIPKIIYSNPELTVPITRDMVDAGHFTIRNDDIEDDGIEVFITRVQEEGIEYDIPWNKRDYLLAEQSTGGKKSFVVMSDEEYEDYINIYTKYAGTGTPLSQDMTVKINVLTSKGPQGATNALIEPLDENFEAKFYIEETLTPNVLHIEGTEIQDTDSIRETAPLFSNTANRAVTKNDYKTICEAQQFIQSAQIWGGEEETPVNKPGHIYFSFIPYSRPQGYAKLNSKYSLKNTDNPELFFTSFYQITGKERYDSKKNNKDQNVIFNMLDNYKIITLQLNYVKPIYMDYKLEVKVFKYKFGQTIDETNEEIFLNVKSFFTREIEHFDTTFYTSSMIRSVDEKIGDDYGIEVDVSFSVDLYDSLYAPDKGCFINATMTDLTNTDNNSGLIGDNDDWKFTMPLDWPIEDLYEESTIVNSIVTRRGRMNVSHLTNCNTEGFLRFGDYLYMELNDGTFKSRDANNVSEDILTNSKSETTEINIMYTKNKNDETAETFKVGSYWIHKTEKIIRLELNSHTHWHIDAQSVVTEKMLEEERVHDNEDGVGTKYTREDLGKLIYYKVHQTDKSELVKAGSLIYLDGKKIETLKAQEFKNTEFDNIKKDYTDDLEVEIFKNDIGEDYYSYKLCPLPREAFTEKTRVMNINPKSNNIKSVRNVFSRFKSIEFVS